MVADTGKIVWVLGGGGGVEWGDAVADTVGLESGSPLLWRFWTDRWTDRCVNRRMGRRVGGWEWHGVSRG